MNTDYSKYVAKDFLEDEFFIQSVYFPTEETCRFWETMICNGSIIEKEYKLARLYLQSIQVKREKMNPEEMDELLDWIEKTIEFEKRKQKKTFYLYAVAACMIGVICASVFVYKKMQVKSDTFLSAIESLEKIEADKNVQLILSPKNQIFIPDSEATIQYAKEGKIQINTQTIRNLPEKQEKAEETKYNQLIVPAGKRSVLTLSDSTCIWVNANTRVIYPQAFEKEKREIYVDGEVYLSVAPDKTRPFIIKTSEMHISVLGTTFDVMAYKGDSIHSVVLVSGSVKVESEGHKEAILTPNDQYLKKNNKVDIHPVNVSDYISWKEGIYQYHNIPLDQILHKLSRYYDVSIYIEDTGISRLTCSGKLELKDDIDRVLAGLAVTVPVKYEKRDKNYYFMSNPEN